MIIGKTLLAKAVANQTAATFLRVVGSELIQKYLVKEKILFLLLPNNLIFFKLDQKMILVKQGLYWLYVTQCTVAFYVEEEYGKCWVWSSLIK